MQLCFRVDRDNVGAMILFGYPRYSQGAWLQLYSHTDTNHFLVKTAKSLEELFSSGVAFFELYFNMHVVYSSFLFLLELLLQDAPWHSD
jgi:hypothetical protein